MKLSRLGLIILALGVIIFGLLGCEQAPAGVGNAFISNQQEGIWVSGTGKVSVKPDLATLSLGVEAQEATVSQAQSAAAQAMNDVINVLKGRGLQEKDIQTQYFSIQQVTRYDPATQQTVVTGYRVTNIVTAKIRDLAGAGAVIDAVAQAGGDLIRVNGLSFSVEDPARYYDEVRTKAVQDARQKASRLADVADVKLGDPTFIAEGTIAPLPTKGVTAPSPAPQPETPISPGEIEISLSVQVAYEILK